MSGFGDELVPEMLSAYLDDELTPSERDAVDARLATSPEWRVELAEVRAARDAVRNLPARDAPDGFWDSLLERVAADDEEDLGADAPVVALVERRPHRRAAWIAAAAAIVIGLVAVIAVPHRNEVSPNVTAVVAQHGAQGSDSGDPVSMLAPVGPLAGFRR
jgi:anti-sigma factor RsiW